MAMLHGVGSDGYFINRSLQKEIDMSGAMELLMDLIGLGVLFVILFWLSGVWK
jgi:hypothetical protein